MKTKQAEPKRRVSKKIPKVLVSLRLDAAMLAELKGLDGWQVTAGKVLLEAWKAGAFKGLEAK